MLLGVRVLAHQGGWDEILFVLAPLLVFAGLLALARRRADQLEQPEPATQSSDVSEAAREETGQR